MFSTLTLTFIVFNYRFELHFPSSNLHLYLHDICFVDAFNLFIPVIMFNMLIIKSSVFFKAQTLLDKSLCYLVIQ